MASVMFERNGYMVYLAAFQISKARRGGRTRSIQIRHDNQIKKSFRYSADVLRGYYNARNKAIKWIADNPLTV